MAKYPRLEVYSDRFVYFDSKGNREEFVEGKQTEDTRERYENIQEVLEEGYLKDKIERLKEEEEEINIELEEDIQRKIEKIIGDISSNTGRAIAGLLCGQLTVKSIEPAQDIRLHKGSNMSHHFSWKQGISLRSIDSGYISPTLRDEGLLKVNRDGVMMTRALAENYPYTKLYKANIKAPQEEWLDILEKAERGEFEPEEALDYIINQLINRGYRARETQDKAVDKFETIQVNSVGEALKLLDQHFTESSRSARLLEVALHSIFQVLEENEDIDYQLFPLGQMRSADKKHGNVADVELADASKNIKIAFDGKYGKSDLENDLREIEGKLKANPSCEELVYVTRGKKSLTSSEATTVENLEETYDIEIRVESFRQIAEEWLDEYNSDYAREWIKAYTESLAQRRRDKAPIDEPTIGWLEDLISVFDDFS